jgi:hypothetical protein
LKEHAAYEALCRQFHEKFKKLATAVAEIVPNAEIRVTVDTSGLEFPTYATVLVNGVEDKEAEDKLLESGLLGEIEALASEYTRIFIYDLEDEEVVVEEPVKIVVEPL